MKLSDFVFLVVLGSSACSRDSGPLPRWMEARADDVRAALGGDVQAMHSLCFDLTYGERGLPKDGMQARVWCAAAAERGEPSAQTLYAQLLQFGQGGPVDLIAAARWYSAAAKQGHVHALYVL